MSSVKLNKNAHSIICETIHLKFFHSVQPFVLPPRTNIAAELGEVKETDTFNLCLLLTQTIEFSLYARSMKITTENTKFFDSNAYQSHFYTR